MVTIGLGALSAQSRSLVERLAKEAPGGYGASKAALSAMARVFARELEPRGMVEQGAASVLWGVRLAPGGPSGGVFKDGKADG